MTCRLCERIGEPVGNPERWANGVLPDGWENDLDDDCGSNSDMWKLALAGQADPDVLTNVGIVCEPHLRAFLLFGQAFVTWRDGRVSA